MENEDINKNLEKQLPNSTKELIQKRIIPSEFHDSLKPTGSNILRLYG